ncbi:MAG TPA: hypothetical protein VMA54_20540 [Steroidobacteraceae bacterium]|nr:hypothetical protein [Steroidobacteraceae bacterium]
MTTSGRGGAGATRVSAISDAVVVLGMHRSGTSFLVRALNLAGLWLGEPEHLATIEGRAGSGNPKGNYEHREAATINEFILRRSGGAWFSPPPRIVADADDRQRIGAFCARLQATRPAEYARWGWKDPRALLTLDVWRESLPCSLLVVAAFRHPTAVARSLLSRNRLPLGAGYALWSHYNRQLLRHMETLPHQLVRFDVDASQLIARTLSLCTMIELRADPSAIAAWHDAALMRSTADEDDLSHAPEAAAIWSELLRRYRAQVPE